MQVIVPRLFIHQIPRGRQRIVQLFKKRDAVAHLVDDLKMRVYNAVASAERFVIGHGDLHFLFDRADAVQVLDVQNDIKNHGLPVLPDGKSPSDLLLVNDGRHRGAQQNHAADIFNMDAFVQRVDAEKKLQMMIIAVCPEVREGLTGRRVVRVDRVDMRRSVHATEPLRRQSHHRIHVLFVRAEDDVLARAACHVLVEHHVQIVRLFQRAAKRRKVSLGFVPDGLALRAAHPLPVPLQVLLIGKYRQHILWRGQNAPENRFSQRDFRGDISVKQLVRHIALIIEIANGRRGQAENRRFGVKREQPLHALPPHFRAAAVKFIENDVVGAQGFYFGRFQPRQLGVGQKGDILRLPVWADGLEIFQLRFKNICAGREPADAFVRMVFAELERDERFARAGRMDDGRPPGFLQQRAGGVIGRLVVLKENNAHVRILSKTPRVPDTEVQLVNRGCKVSLRGITGTSMLTFSTKYFKSVSNTSRIKSCTYVSTASFTHRRNVRWVMFNCAAACLAESSPRSHCRRTCEKFSGFFIGCRPKCTPRALAAAMPSACRCRMNSRSVCAT